MVVAALLRHSGMYGASPFGSAGSRTHPHPHPHPIPIPIPPSSITQRCFVVQRRLHRPFFGGQVEALQRPRGAPRTVVVVAVSRGEYEARLPAGAEDGGWGGRKLRPVVDIGRQRETAGDGGSLLRRVSRASAHGQEK